MQSLLEEFALGNINTIQGTFKSDSRYGRAAKNLYDIEEKLEATLTAAQKEMLEEYVCANCELDVLTETDRFVRGYRLGVLMTMEVFAGKSDLVIDEQ